jgi:hypothetical protein
MNFDDGAKRFAIHRLKWSIIYVGLGIILVLVLPFPYDFFFVIALFVMINFLRDRSIMKRYGGTGGIKDLFSSISSSMSANDKSSQLKYYCMSCGRT